MIICVIEVSELFAHLLGVLICDKICKATEFSEMFTRFIFDIHNVDLISKVKNNEKRIFHFFVPFEFLYHCFN